MFTKSVALAVMLLMALLMPFVQLQEDLLQCLLVLMGLYASLRHAWGWAQFFLSRDEKPRKAPLSELKLENFTSIQSKELLQTWRDLVLSRDNIVVGNTIPDDLPDNTVKACTHSTVFHGDDALSVILYIWMQRRKDPTVPIFVLRTRDDHILKLAIKQGFALFDIGGLDNPESQQFDHHQTRRLNPDGVPFCATGLLYEHTGLAFVKDLCVLCGYHDATSADVKEVAEDLRQTFIATVDESDAGYQAVYRKGQETKHVDSTTFCRRVANYNPISSERVITEDERNNAFIDAALYLALPYLLEAAERSIQAIIQDRRVVERAVAESNLVYPGGQIIILPYYVRDGRRLIRKVENDQNTDTILHWLYTNTEGNWVVQHALKSDNQGGKHPFSFDWNNQSEEWYQENIDVQAKFAANWIFVAYTKESAMKVAIASCEQFNLKKMTIDTWKSNLIAS